MGNIIYHKNIHYNHIISTTNINNNQNNDNNNIDWCYICDNLILHNNKIIHCTKCNKCHNKYKYYCKLCKNCYFINVDSDIIKHHKTCIFFKNNHLIL